MSILTGTTRTRRAAAVGYDSTTDELMMWWRRNIADEPAICLPACLHVVRPQHPRAHTPFFPTAAHTQTQAGMLDVTGGELLVLVGAAAIFLGAS